MKLTLKTENPLQVRSPLLVLPSFEGERPPAAPAFGTALGKAWKELEGEFGAGRLLYPARPSPVERILLLGAGKAEDLDPEKIRRLAGKARNRAASLGVDRFSFAFPLEDHPVSPQEAGAALAEGLLLSAYKFDRFKKKTSREDGEEGKKEKKEPRRVLLFPRGKARAREKAKEGLRAGAAAARGQNLARELGDLPSNLLTPALFASRARKVAREWGYKCTVLGEKEMARLKMGAFLGVALGSSHPPRLVVLQTRPSAPEKVCVVGKGLTFDSGGISLKPSRGMDEMRYDMCGAAAVLGLFQALEGGRDLPFDLVGVLGLAENMPDGNAQRPGDLVTACDGTTIEVLNTDAEGRLVLADCIAFCRKRFKPKAVVDLATLTGACVVALGHEASGLLSNHDPLAEALLRAGENTGERCWRLPLWKEYKDLVKGSYGDLKNIGGPGAGAGTITAAAFLGHFAGDTPWAHLDIAGTAYNTRKRDYYQGGAFGVGVRLLFRLFKEEGRPWKKKAR